MRLPRRRQRLPKGWTLTTRTEVVYEPQRELRAPSLVFPDLGYAERCNPRDVELTLKSLHAAEPGLFVTMTNTWAKVEKTYHLIKAPGFEIGWPEWRELAYPVDPELVVV